MARPVLNFPSVNLNEMHKEILAWDLFKMLENNAMYTLRDVPLCFGSIDEYLDIFEPLLLEECRAQTLRNLHAATESDHHLELAAVEANEPFRLLHFEMPQQASRSSEDRALFESRDLVFISHEQLNLDEVDGEGNGQQEFHALGLVERIVADRTASEGLLIVKVYLPEEPTSRLPPIQHKRLLQLRKVMIPASGAWYVRKLGNMVTINRECQALQPET